MPPKKEKGAKDKKLVSETPVIFFLKISEQDSQRIVPAESVQQSYSEILDSVETSRISEKFNTELLKSILEKTNIEKYSQQTVCFWCCHHFNWIPTILPLNYDSYKDIYVCQGHFCSPECALAHNYADNGVSDIVRWNRHSLLRHLYTDLYKTRELSPAPPRSILRIFGGPLDIEQFREHITSQNDLVFSELPPIRMYFPSMNVQGPLRDVKKYVSLSTEMVEKASEQLRLKRLKPITTNNQTLDKCIKH